MATIDRTRPAFVEELRRQLEAAGIPLSPSRFPFTYHHDLVRMPGPSLSRASVAAELELFRLQHGNDAYWAEACLGAVAYVMQEQPVRFLAALVAEGQSQPLGDAIRNCCHMLPADCGSGFLPRPT